MIVTSLPHWKWFVAACHTENGFHELTIQEQIFTVLKHRKWLLGICQTENGFYELATQKIFFGCLRHGKWFSTACQFLNLQPAWGYICGYLFEKVNPYLVTVTKVCQYLPNGYTRKQKRQNIVWAWYIYAWQNIVFVGLSTFKVQKSSVETPRTPFARHFF